MDYILHILILINIYIVLALSCNILLGYLGILYMAHPAIYGIGAYTLAILSMHGVSFFPALFAGGVFAMLATLILSLPSLRLKSHFIGMTSIGFLIIVSNLILNLRDLTRGGLGIPGIPRPTIFGYYLNTNFSFYLFSLAVTVIVCLILYRLFHSPWMKTLESIREDETAAKTLGKNIKKHKIQAFLITGFIGGIGGGLFASYLGFINANNFHLEELIVIVTVVVIGGLASFWGSILGAIIIIILPEPLRFLALPPDVIGALRYAIYGLILISFMIFKPTGFLGKRTNIFLK